MTKGIVALIQQSAAVTAIIGSVCAPLLLPEGAQGITYQIIGGRAQPTFNTSGMQRWRIQFNCHAASYAIAYQARSALIMLLNGYQGTLSDGTFLSQCQLIQPIDYFDNDARQFRCGVEFYFDFTTL